MTKTDIVLEILKRVPLPFVPDAARAIDTILDEVHQAHAEAAAIGRPAPTPDAWKDAVRQAATAALEPWKRIQQAASDQLAEPPGSSGD